MVHPAVISAVSALVVLAILTAQFGWWAGATAGLLTLMSWSTGVMHERYRDGFSLRLSARPAVSPTALGDPD